MLLALSVALFALIHLVPAFPSLKDACVGWSWKGLWTGVRHCVHHLARADRTGLAGR
jgi:uncharacterized membrane protein